MLAAFKARTTLVKAVMKKRNGGGRTIIATARKAAVITWRILSERTECAEDKMIDGKLAKEALAERHEKPAATGRGKKEMQKTGVASEKRKKAG
jgi:hypothetical protein